eukprot:258329_1
MEKHHNAHPKLYDLERIGMKHCQQLCLHCDRPGYAPENIGSFEGKASDEERLKLTTILRWMNFKSCVFKEVECVKNKYIIVSLYHSLDKYLEYKAGDNGKGAVIKRMRRNKYGKPLSAKYGLNEEWCITSIYGVKVNNKKQNEINNILKQVDLNQGYQATFKKLKK